MVTRRAECACGQLSAVCAGEPFRVSVCHCLDCKRRSGSAFAYGATFVAGQVASTGEFRTFTRTSDEGRWARFHFCPACGSNVFYEIEVRPGMVTVPAGGFAAPDFPEPKVSVYENRRCPWVELNTAGPMERD